tara:strand:+ start:1790 stop:2191 length:402 start_codon:yes stop_codon:yes gene_type:complete
MADILLHKGDIELGRADLDGAHLRFDSLPDRNVLVAKSGQTYVLNEAVGRIERHGFSVHPITIEITGRKIRYSRWDGPSVRVRVFFDTSSPLDGNLASLFFSNNAGRLINMNHYYNLDYRVRPRIEDVEEYGE